MFLVNAMNHNVSQEPRHGKFCAGVATITMYWPSFWPTSVKQKLFNASVVLFYLNK